MRYPAVKYIELARSQVSTSVGEEVMNDSAVE